LVGKLSELFADEALKSKIVERLPHLFTLAAKETSRAGNIGMQAGSLRENIIIALLIYKFGKQNVRIDKPIIAPEVDVEVFGVPVSIKTVSSKGLTGVKLVWTVDAQKAREFSEKYSPRCDMLFVHIIWGGVGGFYYIPLALQRQLFDEMGREGYMKLPKPGTNPRGVEISKEALLRLIRDEETKSIGVNWQRVEVEHDPYKRWVDYWREA